MLRHFTSPLSWNRRVETASVRSFSGRDASFQASGVRRVPGKTLNFLSYNIQVGINSRAYRHYLTRSWQHFLPHPERQANLDRIAALLSRFDVVALQEADGGSIRTNHLNQVEYLARVAGFPHWYQQLNRNLGKFAQHGNGVLSRIQPQLVEDHKLPGLVPGRGAILMKFGRKEAPLVLVVLHLSLGRRARENQLCYVRELISDYPHVVVMGDLNSGVERLLKLAPVRDANLKFAQTIDNTYPSWRPIYNYDHILVSPDLTIRRAEVLPYLVSDHLPVAIEVDLPRQLAPIH